MSIEVDEFTTINAWEYREEFIRSSGPGGQNVNKVATAVVLKFHVDHSTLSPYLKRRLKIVAKNLINSDGELVISSSETRSQLQNRENAKEKLVELIKKAKLRPKKRKPTKATKGSKERRLKTKKIRSDIKKGRQKVRES